MTGPVLEARQVSMAFGGVRAVDRMDLDLRAGEIAALIGPNGAGKTTLFNCITGLCKPTGGEIVVRPPGQPGETRLNGLSPDRITARGLARTFQNIRLFPGLTVLENVMVGRHCRTRSGILGALLRDAATRREEMEVRERSFSILEEIGIARHAATFAGALPYGAQRRLEIARALATDPFLLLLDEPAAGMNPQETRELDKLILELRERRGLAILLIEHDMKFVMRLAERIFVMESGRGIARGSAAEIRANPAVIKAYLGEETHG